ncbi:MAG: ABC transporter ATP-binding protein [Dehalococcoidia bacterium]
MPEVATDNDVILEIRDLHSYFFTKDGVVKAVNGVNLSLKRQMVLGILGESGCGKTTTALSILDLLPFPGEVVDGEIIFKGKDLLGMDEEEIRLVRGNEISISFQDATSALNPVTTVGSQVEEVITAHYEVSPEEARDRAVEALERMELPDPGDLAQRYPFQLSGGMSQRVMMAMALALEPEVLIADEPTSAVDVTVQAYMVDRLRKLKEERSASIILISHDLGVIAQLADMVAVMYAGSIVEYSDTTTVFQRPSHPYTAALIESVPRIDRPDRRLKALGGTPPSLLDPPDECPFIPRCNKALSKCRTSPQPDLEELEPGHGVACYNRVLHDWD